MEAGRFGAGFDLTIQVVVPAVVTLLANALSACGREALSALRGRNRQEIAELLELQTGAVTLVIRRTGSKRLRRRQPEIVRAVMAAAKRELGAGEERGAR